jgi:hypothetical protein
MIDNALPPTPLDLISLLNFLYIDLQSLSLINEDQRLFILLQSVEMETRLTLLRLLPPAKQFYYLTKLTSVEMNDLSSMLSVPDKKALSRMFTKIRTDQKYTQLYERHFLSNIIVLGRLLDTLVESLSHVDLEMILWSKDPILTLSRFSTRERRFLKYMMSEGLSAFLVTKYLKDSRTFPEDYFKFKFKDFDLSDERLWLNFWSLLVVECRGKLSHARALTRKQTLTPILEEIAFK